MGEDKRFDRVSNRARIAETNEATFRKLLEEAHEVLSHLPLPSPVIADLRYRILDTLNETKPLREREW